MVCYNGMVSYNEKESNKGSPDGRTLESTLPPSKGKENPNCEDKKIQKEGEMKRQDCSTRRIGVEEHRGRAKGQI